MYRAPTATQSEYYRPEFSDDHIICDWKTLKAQLLYQWRDLTAEEIDAAGPHRRRIAHVVARKYGIAATWIEHYLRNFERTMPL